MKELIESVKQSEKTLKVWRNNHASQEWKNANKVNEFLTGISLNKRKGCECIEDLFFLIKRNNINQTIRTEMNRNFKLKPGKVIMLHGCTPITAKATDEQLINLLKLSPAHIAQFESYPENWKEICGISPKGESKQESESNSSNEEDAQEEDQASNDDNSNDGEDSTDENENAQEAEEDDNSNDGESPQNEERKNELLEMKNDDLKDILIDEMKQELPKKATKANLVDAILEAEAKQ